MTMVMVKMMVLIKRFCSLSDGDDTGWNIMASNADMVKMMDGNRNDRGTVAMVMAMIMVKVLEIVIAIVMSNDLW